MEKFFQFIATGLSNLSNFLQISSGGEQIRDIKAHIQPTLDLEKFIYPITSVRSNTFDTSATLPLNGGRGIYRIRVVATFTGLSAATYTSIQFIMSTVALPTTLGQHSGIGVTQALNINIDMDFLLDLKSVASETAVSLSFIMTEGAAVSTSRNSSFIVTAQRVV